MTNKNDILDELHAIREQMLADAGGTLAGLVAKIQADQARSGRVIVKTTVRKGKRQHDEAASPQVESLSSPPGDR